MKSILRALAALFILAGGAAFAAESALAPAVNRPEILSVGSGQKTATAVNGAATLAKGAGIITSETLTTAAGATYTLTITDPLAVTGDMALASVSLGTSTTGLPEIATVTAGGGAVTIVVRNAHASAPLNGTIVVSFLLLKA